jgi:hypothetical protein
MISDRTSRRSFANLASHLQAKVGAFEITQKAGVGLRLGEKETLSAVTAKFR